jgi:tyrosine-protein kinase Etk/Wzc
MGSIGSISELRAALWRQAWLILLVLALGLPAVYYYAKSQPRVYEATGVVGLDGPQGTIMLAGQPSPDAAIGRRLEELQQTIMSRPYILDLLDRYDLLADIESELVRISLVRGAIVFNRLIDPSQSWRPDVQPYGLSVSVRLEDPEKAAEIANALLETIVAEDTRHTVARQEASVENLNSVLDYLVAEERRVSQEVDGVESEIALFRVANASSLPENLDFQHEQLAALEERRDALDREINGFERTGTQRPSDAVELRRTGLEEQRQDLLEEIDAIEAIIDAAPEVERELGALTRQRDNLETELDAIVTERTQATISQTLAVNNLGPRLVVRETALPPEYAISRSRKKVALAGAFAVGAVALGLAVARELLNPVIRTAAQMQRQLNIVPVVVIPHVGPRLLFPWRRSLVASLAGILALLALSGSPPTSDLLAKAAQLLQPGELSAWLNGSGDEGTVAQ